MTVGDRGRQWAGDSIVTVGDSGQAIALVQLRCRLRRPLCILKDQRSERKQIIFKSGIDINYDFWQL